MIVFCFTASAQVEAISATLKNGNNPNSVIVALKSNQTFTGSFSNIQLTIQIPNTVSPQPTVSVLANSLVEYWPSLTSGVTPDAVVNEGGYFNYTFNKNFVSIPNYTFTSGVEVNALELQFTGAPGISPEIRLGHLADGGSEAFSALYMELGGVDYTNYTSMFYGAGSTNGGSYSAYSFVPLLNIPLPASLFEFSLSKKEDNALLNWTILDQTAACKSFEIERSTDGRNFRQIASVAAVHSDRTTANYQYTDQNINAYSIQSSDVYYRIRQVDFDNKSKYSNIRMLPLTKGIGIAVFPNPCVDKLLINYPALATDKLLVQVYDNKMQMVRSMQQPVLKGANIIHLDCADLAGGMYQVVITSKAGRSVHGFIKNN
jgi:hypothetical protein